MSSELDAIIKSLSKDFGQGSAYRFDELPDMSGVRGWIPCGIPQVEKVMGRPGIPVGKVSTIIGNPSASKTTLATHFMIGSQRSGYNTFYFNTECSYDPERSERIGLDLHNISVSQPGTCEEAFEMIGAICGSVSGKIPTLIVWDTFSASPTNEEVYGTGEAAKRRMAAGEMNPDVSLTGKGLGGHSRIASEQLRKLQGPMDQKGVTLLVILQSKENIDITWGSGVTYLAERPWYFYSQIQFECKRTGTLKNGEVPVGIAVEVHARKNKVAPPFRKCTVECMFDNGIDIYRPWLDEAVRLNVVNQSGGGWFVIKSVPESLKELNSVKFTRNPQANSTLDWKNLCITYPDFFTYLMDLSSKKDM